MQASIRVTDAYRYYVAWLAPSITATYELVGVRERALASDQLRQLFLERGLSEAQALGEGLRWSLRIIVAVNLWSAAHYFIAARTLRAEEVKG